MGAMTAAGVLDMSTEMKLKITIARIEEDLGLESRI